MESVSAVDQPWMYNANINCLRIYVPSTHAVLLTNNYHMYMYICKSVFSMCSRHTLNPGS